MNFRLAYVVTRAEIGGAQTHIADLLEGFREQIDLVLVTGEKGYLTDVAESLGIPYYIVPDLVSPMAPLRDLKALVQMTRLFRKIRPDLVHAHTSKAGILGRITAKLLNIPSVFTAHTWCFAEGTSRLWHWIGTPLERLVASLGKEIITVSEANRELAIRNGLTPEQLNTVHNGIADIPLQAEPGTCQGVVRIISVARIVPQKKHEALLEAATEIGPAVEVLLVGDGPKRSAMESYANDLGIAERIHFLGDRTDVAKLLASAHLFALPTRWEGFPISILEAMRCGLPVVAHDAGGIREAVVDGVTGYVVPLGDDIQFATRVKELVEDAALRERFGDAARRRYLQFFTREAMLRQTMAVYRSALRAKPLGALDTVREEY